ncbi:MAG: hypothetical protein JXR94_01180 [Candidatus Hydrogenedentes bacterium]|nr:hypothetical protein [Candidatus Hydrogenedentota bacterium]
MEELPLYFDFLARKRVKLLRQFAVQFQAYCETDRLLDSLERVLVSGLDVNGKSQVSLLPMLCIMQRQCANAIEDFFAALGYQGWMTFRPAVEAALIIGKWFDDRHNCEVWIERRDHKEEYLKAYRGKALRSSSLPNSPRLQSLLSKLNDEFLHVNFDYYRRHMKLEGGAADNLTLTALWTDTPLVAEAHVTAFAYVSRLLVCSVGEMLKNKFQCLHEFADSSRDVAESLSERVSHLIAEAPEVKRIFTELAAWPRDLLGASP